jgi:PhzF family phenazine biosynthesis protein
VQIVSSGRAMLMLPLLERVTLHSLAPDFAALAELCDDVGAHGCFAFTLDAELDVLTHARMFAPESGCEDPVTGMAHGPLGIYLIRHGLARHEGGTLAFRSRQGEAMGRPGNVSVEVTIDDGQPVQVRVGGHAVIAFDTRLQLADAAAAG